MAKVENGFKITEIVAKFCDAGIPDEEAIKSMGNMLKTYIQAIGVCLAEVVYQGVDGYDVTFMVTVKQPARRTTTDKETNVHAMIDWFQLRQSMRGFESKVIKDSFIAA